MNVEGDDEDPDETRTLARIPREMAVVTNSPTVRMFDPSTMSCVGSLSGHSAVVLCVDAALASDGTALIITGAKDHAVRLWDAASRSCVAVGEGHVGAVAAVAFSARKHATDGHHFVAHLVLVRSRTVSSITSDPVGIQPSFRPSLVSSPRSFNAPSAYNCSSARSNVSAGGGSMKYKVTSDR